MGLYAQEDPIAVGGDGTIVRVGDSQLLGQNLALATAVSQGNVFGGDA